MSPPTPFPSLQHQPRLSLLCTTALIFVALLYRPYRVAATCEQCALTGNCTAALPNNAPGTFCSTTTTNYHTSYLCCPSAFTCRPSSTLPPTLTCQLTLSSLSSSDSSSSSSSSSSSDSGLTAHSYVSYAFIGVSLLFAAFLAFLVCCVCCNVLTACGGQWKRQWRRDRAMKGVAPIENEEERRDREQREVMEREEVERQQEQRDATRVKEERLQREQAEMDAILQRAREQVERRRRERQKAVLEGTEVTSEDQRTMDGREIDMCETEEGGIHRVDEIELANV